MGRSLQLRIHGKGNAWPVPLGETHPYYDRSNTRELSNAAFSLHVMEGNDIFSSILVDAGHGTIQSLISGSNRIPDCICLTHGHMDHTLSVDWIVQSYWRKHDKKRPYPIYATKPVYEFFIQSYPHLSDQVDFRILDFGKGISLDHDASIKLTAYPAYHGQGAYGASMLLFEPAGRKILFTGDLLTPLLRKVDYTALQDIDLLVVDSNNRFPWPRTNHWSFAGDPDQHLGRSEVMVQYFAGISWKQLMHPYKLSSLNPVSRDYFMQAGEEWSLPQQPLSIMEFLEKTNPRSVMPVHYSGAEDLKYHGKDILAPDELANWIFSVSRNAGLKSEYVFPDAGELINI
ncbi:MAG: MBL fold metallo-hydrolase [Bacteroidota bacterium]